MEHLSQRVRRAKVSAKSFRREVSASCFTYRMLEIFGRERAGVRIASELRSSTSETILARATDCAGAKSNDLNFKESEASAHPFRRKPDGHGRFV